MDFFCVSGKQFRAVILTTVRTRHMIDDPHGAAAASRLDTSECDGDSADFGFLSDQKLLNTALTRAQSFVGVVGDPVALCSVGGCVTMWRAYLKHCSNLKSIVPSSVTLESVRKAVNNISLGQQGGNLAELNRLAEDAEAPPPQAPPRTQQQAAPLPVTDAAAQGGIVDQDLVNTELAEDTVLHMLNNEVQSRHPGQVKMTRKSEAIVLTTDSAEASASPASSGDEAEVERDIRVKFTEQQLLGLCANEPNKYLQCTLHKDKALGIYAIPVEKDTALGRIVVGSWQKCGGAFVDDEVVIEVLEERIAIGEQTLPAGKVMDVIKRSHGKVMVAVCQPSSGNHNLMIPLNDKLPPVQIIVPKHHAEKINRGNVLMYGTKTKHLVPHHYEPIDSSDSKLFVVRYLKYDEKLSCNLGVVAGVLPVGKDLERTLKILDMDNGIQRDFKARTLDEIQALYPENFKVKLSPEELRLNYSAKQAFTIGGEGGVIQNAFSVELRRDGMYYVAVHVADVGYFVEQGGKVDLEAQSRSSSVSQPDFDMLPDRLSGDLCKFKAGEERFALSLFFTIDSSATIQELRPLRSLIRSCQNVPYSEVEKALTSQPHDLPQELAIALQVLYSIACNWRMQRLGNAATTSPSSASNSPKAHLLVEEILLAANHNVAQYMIMQGMGALCRQLWPHEAELRQWREANSGMHVLCPSLLWPHTRPGHRCQCVDNCQCAPSPEDLLTMNIAKHIWNNLVQLAQTGNQAKVQEVVLSADLHPRLNVAKASLDKLVVQEDWVSVADDCRAELYYHTGLHVEEYTHFTTPVTCYMDLVVHRFLVNLIDKNQAHPYSRDDLQKLCAEVSQVHRKTARHHEDTKTAHAANKLQAKPVVSYPVVEGVYNKGIELLFQSSDGIPSLDVPLADIVGWNGSGKMTLKLSLYDNENPASAATSDVNLSSKPFQVQLHKEEWLMMVKGARSFDPKHLCELVQYFDANSKTLSHSKQSKESGVCSEIDLAQQHSFEECTCTVTTQIKNGTVVKVQIGGKITDGIVRPQVQLFHLTHSVAFCLCHMDDPVACFSPDLTSVSRQSAAKTAYRDIESYKNSWQPLVMIEAIETAVQDADSMKFIRNIPMALQANHKDVVMSIHRTLFNRLNYHGGSAYVCIQYSLEDGSVWIGHGVLTSTEAKGSLVELQVSIVEENVKVPAVDGLMLVTVQFIPVDWKNR